jgi:DivIVA domain-containing protein
MFAQVRMREGYDLAQVDRFMAEVAAAFADARART